MMPQTNINIRMDENLKKQFDMLCGELGLNMTTAFNIFARTVVRQQRIPFEVALDVPNADTIAAMKEAERIGSDPAAKRFASFSALLAEVQDEI